MPFDALDQESDEMLLVAFGQGDRAAAQELTRRLTPKVLGYATRMLNDRAEAEDVTQDAMLRLWKVSDQWRTGEAKVTTWLYRVVTNLCTDRLRKKRMVDIDAIQEPEDGALSVEMSMVEQERQAALQAALQELPERQRQAVVLRHIEGVANPEIATIMDISIEAVESLTARGKRALAAILAGKREELGYENE